MYVLIWEPGIPISGFVANQRPTKCLQFKPSPPFTMYIWVNVPITGIGRGNFVTKIYICIGEWKLARNRMLHISAITWYTFHSSERINSEKHMHTCFVYILSVQAIYLLIWIIKVCQRNGISTMRLILSRGYCSYCFNTIQTWMTILNEKTNIGNGYWTSLCNL